MLRTVRRAAILLASWMMMVSPPAYSHTPLDPEGTTVTWYPLECCNNQDCRPVASVRSTRGGLWMTTVDGRIILVGHDEPRRPSRDLRWHICLTTDVYSNVVIQCLFEPPNS